MRIFLRSHGPFESCEWRGHKKVGRDNNAWICATPVSRPSRRTLACPVQVFVRWKRRGRAGNYRAELGARHDPGLVPYSISSLLSCSWRCPWTLLWMCPCISVFQMQCTSSECQNFDFLNRPKVKGSGAHLCQRSKVFKGLKTPNQTFFRTQILDFSENWLGFSEKIKSWGNIFGKFYRNWTNEIKIGFQLANSWVFNKLAWDLGGNTDYLSPKHRPRDLWPLTGNKTQRSNLQKVKGYDQRLWHWHTLCTRRVHVRLGGRLVSSKSPSRVRDVDRGVAGRNGREVCFPAMRGH